MAISPTAEGFRAAFRRPSLTFAEIMWRWVVGATAATLFLFGLFQYLNTLPVTDNERLFLRTRQPFLIAQALAQILRGSLDRAVMAALVAVLMLVALWIVAASIGRIATVRALLDYFRRDVAGYVSAGGISNDGERDVASNVSTSAVMRLNFLRAVVALAAILGFMGAMIVAGLASSSAHPRPGVVFLLLPPMIGLVCMVSGALNWLLSMAGMFAVRDGADAISAISAAVAFCLERTGPVFAVSSWTGLAHMVVFVGASTVVAIPLGFMPVVPWRLVVVAMMTITLVYLAIADWLYMARLAGYVCIAEMPEALLNPLPPAPQSMPPGGSPLVPRVQTTIDRDEVILSDVPNLAVET